MNQTSRTIILDPRLQSSNIIDDFATKILIIQQNNFEVLTASVEELSALKISSGERYVLMLYFNAGFVELEKVIGFLRLNPTVELFLIEGGEGLPIELRKHASFVVTGEEFKREGFSIVQKLEDAKSGYLVLYEQLFQTTALTIDEILDEHPFAEASTNAIDRWRSLLGLNSFDLSSRDMRDLTESIRSHDLLLGVTVWDSVTNSMEERCQYNFSCLDKVISLTAMVNRSRVDRYTAMCLENIFSLFQNWYVRQKYSSELEREGKKFALTQKALIQAEKLSVAGRMTASIAHEINNPLQGVKNCLHLLSNKNISEEQKTRYLEMTNQEMDRLTNTVQQMLEFYKPNEKYKPVQVLDVLEHTLNLLDNQLSENGIKIKTIWPPKIPLVSGIKNQIEQVFINLVINAKDAMPSGGELTLTIESAKPFLAIIFEDSGAGVPDDMREKIFEPFVSTKGTSGLGLSVCNEIIKNHSGVLELMDKIPNHGARFKIILPIKP